MPSSKRGEHRSRWRGAWAVAMLCLASLAPTTAQAQAQSPALHEVQAAYILKFATYVHWPAGVFRNSRDALVVGVMDDIDLARALERAVRGRTANGKPLRVVAMRAVDPPRGVHVLVLPRLDHPARRRLLRDLEGKPVLTIAPPDQANSADPIPAMVQLVLEDNRLRFDVDPPDQPQGLRISALMLTAARRVEGDPR